MNKAASLAMVILILGSWGCGPSGPPDDEDPPDDPVAVNIIETSASVEVGHTFQFHSSVSNTSNTACAWSVNDVAGGNATIGTIGADGLYTAPAAVPNPSLVTVKAVAAADSTKSDTAAVTITAPPPFTIFPPSVTVPAGATQPFTTAAEVNWSLEGAAGNTAPLGSIASDGLYTAPLAPPLGAEVTIVATAKSDTSLKATAVATITFSNASLQGHYAFRYRATDAGEMMFVAGCFTADGGGVISDGSMAMISQYRGGVPSWDLPFTGAYQVQADGRASMQLNVGAETFPFRLALVSSASARLIAFETDRTGAGDLEQQDPSSFAAGLSGAYVFAYDGMGHVLSTGAQSGQPIAAAGRFNVQDGTLSEIVGDINVNGVWQAGGLGGSSVWGTYTPAGALPGVGYLALGGTSGPQAFRSYMISADAVLLVSLDWGSLFPKTGATGLLMRQASGPFNNASLSGYIATLGWGYGAIPTPTPDPYVPPWTAFSAAVLASDGSGHITGGTADNMVHGVLEQALPALGAYEIAANGRGGLTLNAGGTSQAAFYMLSADTAYTVGLDSWGTGISRLAPQAVGRPFSVASVNGRYAFTLRGTLSAMGTDVTGQILLNGQGALAGAVDVNASGTLSENLSAAGFYTMNSSGRGTATINASGRTWTVVLYLAEPGKVLVMGTGSPSYGSLVRQY